MNQWIALINSLPTENATVRMRVWRTLKTAGAVALRNGVYLMPDRKGCRATLETISSDITGSGGSALLVGMLPLEGTNFAVLFDRSADYAMQLSDIVAIQVSLTLETAVEVLKQTRKLSRTFFSISDIDFFPGEARKQVEAALQEVEARANQLVSPDEPQAVAGAIKQRAVQDYNGKIWATRKRPWVDRLACAWLIRRFIDSQATFLWLDTPADCPPSALGFDFDGAMFTHVGARVSFEVLIASFDLATPALSRVGALVHYLDIGGVQPVEAAGVESVLAGLRTSIADDDQLTNTAFGIFDALFINYQQDGTVDRKAEKP